MTAPSLREIASEATPGPWFYVPDKDGFWFTTTPDQPVEGAFLAAGSDYDPLWQIDPLPANAAFIAAANPTVVLALLDRIEAADYLIAQMDKVARGTPVRDLDEAWSAYVNARSRATASLAKDPTP